MTGVRTASGRRKDGGMLTLILSLGSFRCCCHARAFRNVHLTLTFLAECMSVETPLNVSKTMNRGNILYLIFGALLMIAGVLSYQLYQDRKQPQGVQILIGPDGASIEKK
jgi:hypothetical protein